MEEQPTLVDFDLDRYLRNSKKVDLSGIDARVQAVPGLGGLHLCEDYLDAALRRAAARAGWAGVSPVEATRTDNGKARVPTHWAPRGARDDAVAESAEV